MKAMPAWGRDALAVLTCVLYALFVLVVWGEYLKLSIITNVFLLIWVVLKYLDLKKETARADSEKLRADEIGERLIDRVGYQVGALEIYIDITNYSGDCRTKWIWTEIEMANPDSPLSSFPGKMWFSTPGCSFSEFPTLMPEYTGKYEIEFRDRDLNSCDFIVRVNEISGDISYGYTASVKKAFYMVEEDLGGLSYGYEWFGFTMTAAVKNLIIKVSFPAHYRPAGVTPDVCIGGMGPTADHDKAEVERIISNNGFKNESREVSITVKKPKMGYLYFICWRPLPRIVVDGIKRRESKY